MTLGIICFFTFLIHLTETLAYCMRLSGLRTKQIAIAMSFVTSTLLISRLSNMFQAPLLGAMVDVAILKQGSDSLLCLEYGFRLIIFSGFLGSLLGAFLTPTAVFLFEKAIRHFLVYGSIPKLAFHALKPRNMVNILKAFRLPKGAALSTLSWKTLPKTPLVLNALVTSVYTIGVLCSLLASAYLPDVRATAINLSGIVNGLATIMFTLFVDPAGARVTDQACHASRSLEDVRSFVFFLQMGRLLGTLLLAQLLLKPFTLYIIWVAHQLSKTVM